MVNDTTIRRVLALLNCEIPKEEQNELWRRYAIAPPRMTIQGHRVIVGKSLAIVRRVLDNGGTKEEVHRALVYFMVCMDALKHKLDHKQCYVDCDIRSLDKKYRAKE